MKTQHVLTQAELKDLQLALAGAVREVHVLQTFLLATAMVDDRKVEAVKLTQSAFQFIRSAQMQTGGVIKI